MREIWNHGRTRKIAAIACVWILAVISFFGAGKKFGGIETYKPVTESLDNKRAQVVEMSGALIGLSVAVAAVPGDATTPVANQIAQMNSYLVIALGAIMLEKFLLPVMGILTWKVLIPAALLLGFIYILCQKKIFLSAALRIAILGIVLFSLIPAGIKVGDVMDASFGTDVMIERVKESISEIDEEAEEADNNNSEDTEKESSIWDKIVHKGEEIVDGVKSGGELLLQKAKVVLGEVMDVVAALIVTSCVIPIGILVILGAIIKALFGVIEKWIPIKKEKQ